MSERTFLEEFLSTARLHGSQIALDSQEGSMTYAELEEASRRFAGHLKEVGVTGREVVAIDLPSKMDLVVAMIGVWMAGGVYLPLDVDWPVTRKKQAIAQAGAKAHIRSLIYGAPLEALNCKPDDPAYVIFTSGSTGKPKAVLVGHLSFALVLKAQIDAFKIGPGDRSLFLLNPAFDASLSDIGTALLSGATLVVSDPTVKTDIRSLVSAIRDHRVSYIDLPPSLLPKLNPDDFPTLRVLVVGGEIASPKALREWARRKVVFNVYGPTEATICTSLCRVNPDTWEAPLLGKTLPGVVYSVRSNDLSPMEDGVPGELVIQGSTLALGYLGDPTLTKMRFVRIGKEMAYRTGDRVLRRPDGEFIFLGRTDRQIKLRGMLVEPAEIERHLLACPGVRRAVVLMDNRGIGLNAFYEGGTTETDLRAELIHVLPVALVPGRFIRVHEWPETSSGKVDSERLSAFALEPRVISHPPQSDLETQLAGIFAEVLNLQAVNRDDDFFSLGGDSFAVLEFLTLAESQGLSFSAGQIYRHRNVASLASSTPGERTGCTTTQDLVRSSESIHVPPATDLSLSVPGQVLLTGATGFLGSRVLRLLLERDERTIVCLVRRNSTELDQLISSEPNRIRLVVGDVSRPRMDLSERDWIDLAVEVDEIWHLAGQVNLVLPYLALRSTNVLGLMRVLELSSRGRKKQIHYASTLSVAASIDPTPRRFCEEDPIPDGVVGGGYAATKIEAEYIIRRARAIGHSIQTYRLGLLTGDRRTGAFAPGCQLAGFIRGLCEIGCAPAGDHAACSLDMTPVDQAAERMIALSSSLNESGIYHIANSRIATLEDIVQAIHAHGIPLAVVDPNIFRARIRAHSNASLAFASAAKRMLSVGGLDEMDLFLASNISFSCQQSLTHLGPIPPVDSELWRTYLNAIFPERVETVIP